MWKTSAASSLTRLNPSCKIDTAPNGAFAYPFQNPEISGAEYQRGELFGFEVKEYLLQKWGRKCAYCGIENAPFEIEHILAKSKGGSNRVSKVCLSCHSCNQAKGNKSVYVGRIAIRFRPSFVLQLPTQKFDVHPKYLKTIHQADGYEYQF